MLQNILKLSGVNKLNKQQQREVKGGLGLGRDTYDCKCGTQSFTVRASSIRSAERKADRRCSVGTASSCNARIIAPA
ncbi:hypothetical protein GCM10009430_44100 [Aquimarina litoralis]|uniref:Natural product n=1 Tax=Aquimarina litoralis TaxID=584605 RepID=A0ABP3UH97_9FLAO